VPAGAADTIPGFSRRTGNFADFLHAIAVCRQSERPDRSRTLPRGEQGRRQMLEVAEADLELALSM
jgi:hypothetical protein